MKNAFLTLAPAVVLALASQSFAQGTPSTTDGSQAASPPASAPRAGAGPGAGGPGGRGHMRGPMGPRTGSDYTPGWSMMTPQERNEFHARMQSAKTAQECKDVMGEHRKTMEERAKSRGTALRAPRRNPCAGLPG
jgi:hypothetical protein